MLRALQPRAFEDIIATLALFRPDVTVYQSPAVPWGGTHEGHDVRSRGVAMLPSLIALALFTASEAVTTSWPSATGTKQAGWSCGESLQRTEAAPAG